MTILFRFNRLHKTTSTSLTALSLLGSLLSGCSILLGNVKPLEEKSERYTILNLAVSSTDWQKINSMHNQAEADSEDNLSSPTPSSDAAYQSQKTSSIISINSACRDTEVRLEHDLKDFTRQLLLGITEISYRDEKNFSLQSEPALQTTVKGKLSGETMMLRTVVLKKANCLYDLMYISRPDLFKRDEATFGEFVASLKFN